LSKRFGAKGNVLRHYNTNLPDTPRDLKDIVDAWGKFQNQFRIGAYLPTDVMELHHV